MKCYQILCKYIKLQSLVCCQSPQLPLTVGLVINLVGVIIVSFSFKVESSLYYDFVLLQDDAGDEIKETSKQQPSEAQQ